MYYCPVIFITAILWTVVVFVGGYVLHFIQYDPDSIYQGSKWYDSIGNISVHTSHLMDKNTTLTITITVDNTDIIDYISNNAADVIKNDVLEKYQRAKQWDALNAIFFVTTLITTIGYGYPAPISTAGKVVTVAAALAGIPLTGFLVATLAKVFRDTNRRLRLRVMPDRDILWRFLSMVSIATLGSTVVILLPAMLFAHIEQWSFWDGAYFAFISITTIGLGDLRPSHSIDNNRAWYRLFLCVWIVFGMVWLTITIGTVQSLFESKASAYVRRKHERAKEREYRSLARNTNRRSAVYQSARQLLNASHSFNHEPMSDSDDSMIE